MYPYIYNPNLVYNIWGYNPYWYNPYLYNAYLQEPGVLVWNPVYGWIVER